jgi:hypothetical protein
MQRQQQALLLIQVLPGVLEPPTVQSSVGLFCWPRLVTNELLIVIDRPHVSSVVSPPLIDEQSIQHSQQPTARMLQLLDLANARVRPHTNFLHQILCVYCGTR